MASVVVLVRATAARDCWISPGMVVVELSQRRMAMKVLRVVYLAVLLAMVGVEQADWTLVLFQ